ncbi:MAG: signal peptidase I [Patescibacteria group bacterium]
MSFFARVKDFTQNVSKEVILLVLLVVLIVLPIRFFVAQPFVVRGESMFPTFDNGDYLIVDEVSYHLGDPKRGDVVVFKYPNDPSVFYIKRVIGLPGETIRISRGEVTVEKVDGSEIIIPEPYVVTEDATYTLERTLGAGQYFVMGDNRPKSSDSRVWGPLPEENIMGRAFLRLLPLEDADVFPGAIQQLQ